MGRLIALLAALLFAAPAMAQIPCPGGVGTACPSPYYYQPTFEGTATTSATAAPFKAPVGVGNAAVAPFINAVVVRFYPGATVGADQWVAYNPDGSRLGAANDTGCGALMQTAVNAAFLAASVPNGVGYDLRVLGGSEVTGGSANCDINPASPLSFPPIQGNHIYTSSVSWISNTGSGVLWQFDSALMLHIDTPASQFVSNGPCAILIKPTNLLPQDHAAGVTFQDSSWRAGNMASVCHDETNGGSLNTTEINVDELNAGTANLGFDVFDPAAGANFSGNTIRIRHLHSFAQTGILVNCPHSGQLHGQNIWEVNGISPDSAGGNIGMSSCATNDHGTISITSAGLTTPFQMVSGSSNNNFFVPYSAASLGGNTDAGTNNQIEAPGVLAWTPVISTSGTVGTPAYTTQAGEWSHDGPWITAAFKIVLSGWTGSPTGNVEITGLPYPQASGAVTPGSCLLSQYAVTGLAATNYGVTGTIAAGASLVNLLSQANNSTTSITAAQAGTTPTLIGVCRYHT